MPNIFDEPPSPPALLLDTFEVCRELAISERTLRGLVTDGALPIVRVGKRAIRFQRSDVQEFIAKRREVRQ